MSGRSEGCHTPTFCSSSTSPSIQIGLTSTCKQSCLTTQRIRSFVIWWRPTCYTDRVVRRWHGTLRVVGMESASNGFLGSGVPKHTHPRTVATWSTAGDRTGVGTSEGASRARPPLTAIPIRIRTLFPAQTAGLAPTPRSTTCTSCQTMHSSF